MADITLNGGQVLPDGVTIRLFWRKNILGSGSEFVNPSIGFLNPSFTSSTGVSISINSSQNVQGEGQTVASADYVLGRSIMYDEIITASGAQNVFVDQATGGTNVAFSGRSLANNVPEPEPEININSNIRNRSRERGR